MTTEEGLLAGKNSVLEALRAQQPINKIFVATGLNPSSIKNILTLAKENKVPVKQVDRKKLDEMCESTNHQGVVATVSPKEYTDFPQLVENALAQTKNPVIVVLDEIADPHNLGAIIRSVEGLGGQGVIIPKHRAVPLTAGVNKAAAGTLSYVPVARVTNLAQALTYLKEWGFWVVGTDAQGEQTAFAAKLDGPLAVVIGSEGKGMGRLIKESCDFVVSLPMQGQVNSLNASVATGIIMYEIVRQRLTGNR